ncbi:MAG: Redoxin domain protein [Caulobacteraceae bacterium]|nr:Redoxin domain protein [Caulobacteraceae bacterium]
MQKVQAARVAVLISAAALLYGIAGCTAKAPSGPAGLASLRKGDMDHLLIPGQPTPVAVIKEVASAPKVSPAAAPQPDQTFKDADGKAVKLADFRGQVLVVNFWATWCAPCKIELPTLGKLQTEYAGKAVKVIAVTVDKPDLLADAKAELAKAPPLALYNDEGFHLALAISPQIGFFPTTVIYDKDGVERARLSAPAAWDGPDAKAVIDAVLATSG